MPTKTIPLDTEKLDRTVTNDCIMAKMTKSDYIEKTLKINKDIYYKMLSRGTISGKYIDKLGKHYNMMEFIIYQNKV